LRTSIEGNYKNEDGKNVFH